MADDWFCMKLRVASIFELYIQIYTHDIQIVHHNPCFSLFILHNIPFDNQGSEINKNDISLSFDIISFTKTFSYIYIYIYICSQFHRALYAIWWYDPHGGVQRQRPKSSNYLKIFKVWKLLILDCSMLRE